ncbi:MAG: hypothetical protein ACE5EN_09270 [Nitrospinota bacterium]
MVYPSPMGRLVIIFLFLSMTASGATLYPKKHYQESWCKAFNGKMDVPVKNGGHADCVTKEYAVDVEFAHNWKDAVAQSVLYAIMTNKKPAIVLIVENPEWEMKYLDRLKAVTGHLDIMLWWVSPTDGVEIYEPYLK